jgi:hypothetical protein
MLRAERKGMRRREDGQAERGGRAPPPGAERNTVGRAPPLLGAGRRSCCYAVCPRPCSTAATIKPCGALLTVGDWTRASSSCRLQLLSTWLRVRERR